MRRNLMRKLAFRSEATNPRLAKMLIMGRVVERSGSTSPRGRAAITYFCIAGPEIASGK